jgi:hypothetical protein
VLLSSTVALPPGFLWNYTQITAPVSITDTAEATATALISPPAITFDGGLVNVDFFGVVQFDTAAAGDFCTVTLFEGATQIARLARALSAVTAAANVETVRGTFRFTPTAAAHTYKVCAFATSVTGTPQLLAGAAGTGGNPPAFIRFTKV